MSQEQSVTISPQYAFIFQCPWFIQRQCAGSPPIPPPLPALNDKCGSLQISVNWIGDGWGCSLTGGVYPPLPLVGENPMTCWGRDRQIEMQCVSRLSLAPPPPGYTPCTAPVCFLLPWACFMHIPLVIGWLHRCLLSFSFFHKSMQCQWRVDRSVL